MGYADTVDDILGVRDLLKTYCETNGGKWKDGNRYKLMTINDPFRLFSVASKKYDNDYLGICYLPNNNGFKVKELGIFDYRVDWTIPSSMGGGGERSSWHNYYEIVYDKPNPPKRDYVVLTMPMVKQKFRL